MNHAQRNNRRDETTVGKHRPTSQDSPQKIVTPETPRLKSGSTMTLTKLRAFDNVLSPARVSKKNLFLEDLSKDSALSIDSVPSKPVRRGSQQGSSSTHNASFPARCTSIKTNKQATPSVVKSLEERTCKNIFFTRDSSKLRKALEQVEALLHEPSPISNNEINTSNNHNSVLPDARWQSSVHESSLKHVSSDVHMPSMPQRTVSSDMVV